MSESFPLPTEPEGVIPSLVERFNSEKVNWEGRAGNLFDQ